MTRNLQRQGEKALQTGETPVGCVLVYEDRIVGYGMNDTNRSMNVSFSFVTSSICICICIIYIYIYLYLYLFSRILTNQGTKHAEFLAIDEMLRQYPRSALRKTDLYVTVEPCVMCASALRQYQIRGVYFGCGNERFGGTGSILTLHSEFVSLHFALFSSGFSRRCRHYKQSADDD